MSFTFMPFFYSTFII